MLFGGLCWLGVVLLFLTRTPCSSGFHLASPRHSTARPLARQLAGELAAHDGGGNLLECKDVSCVFDDVVVNQSGTVVVDFYADWCGPCKIAAKTFAAIAQEYPDKSVKFVKVDTETHEDTVDLYGLKGLPVFGVFKDGKLIKKHEGNIGKEKLLDFINGAIAATA